MKIKIPRGLTGKEILRRSSYGLITNSKREESFVRRLGNYNYPRFHVYLEPDFINLHLDQKAMSYEGFNAHNGEYGGEVVGEEAQRIADVMDKLTTRSDAVEPALKNKEKKGFFFSWFGDR